MNYVYSTISADNEYTTEAGPVVIYGRLGARIKKKVDTPRGVATMVSDEQLEGLRKHPLFLEDEKNGFLSVQRKELTESKVERLVEKDMRPGDKSSQETKETLKKKSKAKPKEG